MSILRVIPRPIRVTLAGRSVLADELTIGDVADLHAWARDRTPDPFEAVAARLEAGPRDREWKQILWDAIDADEVAPASAAEVLDSGPGMARQVWLALRGHNPELNEAEVDALLVMGYALTPETTRAEVRRILRVAWAVTPHDVMKEMVQGPDLRTPGDTDWPGLFRHYQKEVGGSAADFAALKIGQLRALCDRGEESQGGSSDADMAFALETATRAAEFWAEIHPPEEAPAG